MRKSRFSEEQIIGLLKQAEAGRKVADLCREHGISEPTFYRWKSKYSGLEVGDAKKLRALEDENRSTGGEPPSPRRDLLLRTFHYRTSQGGPCFSYLHPLPAPGDALARPRCP